MLTAVTGVSGSGKSTLVDDILYRALARRLLRRQPPSPAATEALEGAEAVDKVVAIDQTPHRPHAALATPPPTPAPSPSIRELFSLVPEARARGYKPRPLLLQREGRPLRGLPGRRRARRSSMHFLPDVYVRCEACKGRRYNRETLEVLYHGRTIADVLDLTVDEAQRVLARPPAAATASSPP